MPIAQEFLRDLNNFLRFKAGEKFKAIYADVNLEELEQYLLIGADANIVAHAAIWAKHLPSLALAFRFMVTENLINHALINSNDEIIKFVLAKQIHFNINEGSVSLCRENRHRFAFFLEPVTTKHPSTGEPMTTSHIAKLPPTQVSELLVRFLADYQNVNLTNFARDGLRHVDYPLIIRCLQYADLNSTHLKSQVLHAAIYYNHRKLLKALISAGASPLTVNTTIGKNAFATSNSKMCHALIQTVKEILDEDYSHLSPSHVQHLKDNFTKMLNLALQREIETEQTSKIEYYIDLGAELTTEQTEILFTRNDGKASIPASIFAKSPNISLTVPMMIAAVQKCQPIFDQLSGYIQKTHPSILTGILNSLFQLSEKEDASLAPYITTQLLPFMRMCFLHGADVVVNNHPTSNLDIVVRIKTSANEETPLADNSPYLEHALIKCLINTGICISMLCALTQEPRAESGINRCLLKSAIFSLSNNDEIERKRFYFRTGAALQLEHLTGFALYILLKGFPQIIANRPEQTASHLSPNVIFIIADYLIPITREKWLQHYQHVIKINPQSLFANAHPQLTTLVTEPANTLIVKKH